MPAKRDFIPTTDAKLVDFLRNFHAVASCYQQELNLSDAELNNLACAVQDLREAMQAAYNAQRSARAATCAKNASRKKMEQSARILVRRIQAAPTVDNALRRDLGITVSAPRRAEVPLFAPSDVKLEWKNGAFCLSWKPNGNSPGVLYMVEALRPNAAHWTPIAGQRRTRFIDKEGAASVQTRFRVQAQRSDRKSAYSEEVGFVPIKA